MADDVARLGGWEEWQQREQVPPSWAELEGQRCYQVDLRLI
jgi:hypothetical protein